MVAFDLRAWGFLRHYPPDLLEFNLPDPPPPPPPFERWLWRSSALTSVIMSIIYMQFKIVSLRWDGPLTIVRVSVPILYIISHVVMMAEVFAALRAMPRNTYDTYEIWNYWPFFSLMCYKTVIGLLWQ